MDTTQHEHIDRQKRADTAFDLAALTAGALATDADAEWIVAYLRKSAELAAWHAAR